MNRRHEKPNKTRLRRRIAGIAARLLAEHGITDYAIAKRKAAHDLGLPARTQLPEDAEVEAELRIFQRVFQADEQIERVADLLRIAGGVMDIVQKFNPYLTGSALDGTAGRYAEIDIQLFTDRAKDVDIFLLNRGIPFQHSTPRSAHAESVLTIHKDDVAVNLIVYPAKRERVAFKASDGRVKEHACLDTVKKLLFASAPRNAP